MRQNDTQPLGFLVSFDMVESETESGFDMVDSLIELGLDILSSLIERGYGLRCRAVDDSDSKDAQCPEMMVMEEMSVLQTSCEHCDLYRARACLS